MIRKKVIILTILGLLAMLLFWSKSANNHQDLFADSIATAQVKTVYYGIRHAEKDRSDINENDPELTSTGLERANLWAKYFDSIPLNGIYSTSYKRTLQTILPTAASQILDPRIYVPETFIDSAFMTTTRGGNWLISGHSNTMPATINALIQSDSLQDIPDHENGRLYRVTLYQGKASLDITTIPLKAKEQH